MQAGDADQSRRVLEKACTLGKLAWTPVNRAWTSWGTYSADTIDLPAAGRARAQNRRRRVCLLARS
jgi:hypothetical protein